MNVIAGVGWIAEHEYGCLLKRMRCPYSEIGSLRSELQETSVLLYPLKRFGKYDLVSKMTCCVSALALYDAGLSYSQTEKQEIGILGTNTQGCLQSNLDFFEDFVANGRTRGRGNIFVYTLPSIPMAEAAIYFNYCGPLLYIACSERQIAALLRHSDGMIRRGEARAMLAVRASEEDALCFVLKPAKDASAESRLLIEDVAAIGGNALPAREFIEILAATQPGQGSRRVLLADTVNRGAT